MRAPWGALAFLTRLPGPEPSGPAEAFWPSLAASTAWFPLAGVAVGLVAALAMTAGSWGLAPEVGVVGALAAGWWMTRGFHLDGLSDCFDGLLCNGTPERRLAVMKDPHAGGLGAASVAIWVLARAAVLHATIAQGTTMEALWVAPILARAPLAGELRLRPAAPGQGLYGRLHPFVSRAQAVGSVVLAGALVAPAVLQEPSRCALGIGLAAVGTAAWWRTWRVAIGGGTGDVLGAGVELRELLFCCAFATPFLRT